MRILLVSQMYPGPDDPDLGTSSRRSSVSWRSAGTCWSARSSIGAAGAEHVTCASRADTQTPRARFRPDVVYAHFLVPAGLWATLFGGAPVVVTAHGQDVENARSNALARRRRGVAVGRAAAVVCVSDWLRGRLDEAVPAAVGKTDGDRLRGRPRAVRAARP